MERNSGEAIGRRTALGAMAMGAVGMGAAQAMAQPVIQTQAQLNKGATWLTAEELGYNPETGRYVLPDLLYDYADLEPIIDAQTMEIHHSKHHAGYVRGLNRALDRLEEIRAGTGDAGLIKHWSREASFHGAGHANHALFWRTMKPLREKMRRIPRGALGEAVTKSFGSFEKLQMHFGAAAKAVEGSGWGWLVLEPSSGNLLVLQGEKQQNMVVSGCVPLLGVDVWEHAYYLNYQNRRGDYVNAWWNIVDWDFVGELYRRATA